MKLMHFAAKGPELICEFKYKKEPVGKKDMNLFIKKRTSLEKSRTSKSRHWEQIVVFNFSTAQ